jgi:Spy/CpxP family protein refolding chaperone
MELKSDIALTAEQLAAAQAIYDRMHEQAVALGKKIVAVETDLDALFSSGSVNPATMRELLDRWGELEAELRFVHLNAHIEMTAVLDHGQRMKYVELRGYASGGGGEHENHPNH